MSTIKLVCSECGVDIDPLMVMSYYEKRVQTMLLSFIAVMVVMFSVTSFISHIDSVAILKELRAM